ncbi:hypothetical protein H2198_004943 [Neophaeococcomyces mojaviensis]|uniref:Uncharacterized protein n=1 Tax=Neophaeococcomyces mojaviensis TaxID=3383035 RepID=A0ACC3A7G4_9EURO|nr:hypothetical protein H2198_004943 [Knufia sp. JES_112]
MGPIEFGRKRLYFLLVGCAATFLLYNLLSHSTTTDSNGLNYPSKPAHPAEPSLPDDEDSAWDEPILPPIPDTYTHDPEDDQITTAQPPAPTPAVTKPDGHPIAKLMQEADARWREYESSRSQSFRQTVEKYRSKYGRHPPPGFKEWYMYARRKNVWNIDDFDHIMDDLRPFWAIEPKVIRTHAAHMWENPEHGVSGIHIRNGTVARVDEPSWRSDTMVEVINLFAQHLPDMDIAMNRLDQPRLLVPWEDLQDLLEKEHKSRVMSPEVDYNFTTNQDHLTNLDPTKADDSERYDDGWFGYPGKQYMEIASKACPPESPARNPNLSITDSDAMYKEPMVGIVTNFNLSSDLCTVGPTIQDLHGMLYSASSILASHKLVPIFSECKVNVNNDIMFPANMYWRHDERYDYDPAEDVPWREKADTILWRGVTSGGVQIDTNWQTMHRQRLVQLMNGTHMQITGQAVNVLSKDSDSVSSSGTSDEFSPFADLGMTPPTTYHNASFAPSAFAEEHSDVGFVESWGCVPNCSFYDTVFSWKPQTTLTSQFRSKYLIDVDGHSFSGRWHAFLQSKSLGLKATIFREWHDSRLFAWRHFVPVDNRYDDLYALLTYFIGYEGSSSMLTSGDHAHTPTRDAHVRRHPQQTAHDHLEAHTSTSQSLNSTTQNQNIHIAPHQEEAKRLARQGREWAHKVLRRDDIEVYMYRLLLEYARLVDDNRDRIGYSGDGTELDRFDAGEDEEGIRGGGSGSEKSRWGIGGWFGGAAGPDEPARPNHGVGAE